MDEILKRGQLDSMYDNICEEFEEEFIKTYGKSEEMISAENTEDEMINAIKEKVKNEDDCNYIMKKISEYESKKLSETCFWNKQYYKLGISDAFVLKNELNNFDKNSSINKYKESIFDDMDVNIYMNFYRKQKKKYLLNQEDYKTILSDINELQKKYPRVKDFFEYKKISEFNDSEKDVIWDIIKLKEYISFLELKFSFILGLREKDF